MKKLRLLFSFVLFIFCCFNLSAQQPDCIKKFSWLTGTWKMTGKESVIVEEWANEHNSLACKSYEVKGNDSTMIETASISCIGGQYFFTYHPVNPDQNGKKESVTFIMISGADNTFIFENKSHDFPQRVVYQKVSATECKAWIEGKENGTEKKIDFSYKRSD